MKVQGYGFCYNCRPATHWLTITYHLTHQLTDHLPINPPTDYHQNSLNERLDLKQVLYSLILLNHLCPIITEYVIAE